MLDSGHARLYPNHEAHRKGCEHAFHAKNVYRRCNVHDVALLHSCGMREPRGAAIIAVAAWC